MCLVLSGADAILMHSKKSDPSDIEAFMKAWNNQVIFNIMLLILTIQAHSFETDR